MKQILTEYDFVDAFRNSPRKDQFSVEGLRALFEYLEEYEAETGEEIELDIIALCCEYVEFDDALDYAKQYGEYPETCDHCGEGLPKDEKDYIETCPECEQDLTEGIMDTVEQNTHVIHIDDSEKGFIIQQY